MNRHASQNPYQNNYAVEEGRNLCFRTSNMSERWNQCGINYAAKID